MVVFVSNRKETLISRWLLDDFFEIPLSEAFFILAY